MAGAAPERLELAGAKLSCRVPPALPALQQQGQCGVAGGLGWFSLVGGGGLGVWLKPAASGERRMVWKVLCWISWGFSERDFEAGPWSLWLSMPNLLVFHRGSPRRLIV